MKIIVSFLIAMVLACVAPKLNNHLSATGGKTTNTLKSFSDDEPIIMHSHVKNIMGTGISGATVSLKLNGTSLPQYTGTTDSNGNYTFDSVAQGNYGYRIVKTGYYTKTLSLALFSNTERTDTLTAQ